MRTIIGGFAFHFLISNKFESCNLKKKVNDKCQLMVFRCVCMEHQIVSNMIKHTKKIISNTYLQFEIEKRLKLYGTM